MHFEYLLNLNYKVVKDNILYVNINDDQNYFILIMVKRAVNFNAPFKFDEVFNRQSVAFYINPSSTIQSNIEQTKKEKEENQELEKMKKLLTKHFFLNIQKN
ncbi:hypothetical protein [Halarcobacter anaerophilus]|uniref:hypothetical protein n=1 Tax=Halarcobacter anaerophilus TaxID=877500 RepID=UPI000AEF718F|nr:hypothetical protein [Halarcobacter anaerophilus]